VSARNLRASTGSNFPLSPRRELSLTPTPRCRATSLEACATAALRTRPQHKLCSLFTESVLNSRRDEIDVLMELTTSAHCPAAGLQVLQSIIQTGGDLLNVDGEPISLLSSGAAQKSRQFGSRARLTMSANTDRLYSRAPTRGCIQVRDRLHSMDAAALLALTVSAQHPQGEPSEIQSVPARIGGFGRLLQQ
jgi:hypothetical protein